MRWSFAIHIVGIIFWLGGLLILTRFARLSSEPGATMTPQVVATLRKCWFVYVIQGLILVALTGLFQLFAGGGPGVYFKQGWFHGKVTLVLVLIAATVMLGMEIKNIAESLPANPNRLRMVQILTIVSMLGIILLTIVFRP